MKEFYGYLRLYINFFQPVMKQLSKVRKDSRVTKRDDIKKHLVKRNNKVLKETLRGILLKEQIRKSMRGNCKREKNFCYDYF